jgi:Zn-finger protein
MQICLWFDLSNGKMGSHCFFPLFPLISSNNLEIKNSQKKKYIYHWKEMQICLWFDLFNGKMGSHCFFPLFPLMETKEKSNVTPIFHWKGQIKDIFAFLSSDIYLFFWEFLISKLFDEIRGNKGKKQWSHCFFPLFPLISSNNLEIKNSQKIYIYIYITGKKCKYVFDLSFSMERWGHIAFFLCFLLFHRTKVKSKTYLHFFPVIYIYFFLRILNF